MKNDSRETACSAAAASGGADAGLLRRAVIAVIEEAFPGLRDLMEKHQEQRGDQDEDDSPGQSALGQDDPDPFTEQDLERANRFMVAHPGCDWSAAEKYARANRPRRY